MMRKLIPGLSLLAITGCVSMKPPYALAGPETLARTLPATPAAVVRATLPVFAELGIPIVAQDPAAGLVQGGEVTLRQEWGRSAVHDRIYCGKARESGIDYALDTPVRFTLGVVASPASNGGSIVRLSFNGAAVSTHRRYATETGRQQCTLAESFAQELLGRIAAGAAAAP